MDVKNVGDVKIINILPRVDAYNAKELEDGLNDLLTGGAKKLICNFEKNEYISSAGLRVFLAVLKSMKNSGGEIVLCSLQQSVQNIFDISGFSRLFKIFNTADEALGNFK
ncbi:MAG TPA: STAS domain-containing protein [Smithellaceae bacterium]|nr:STAS domain-containing protein [Smithellaceae bacterium]